MSQGRAFEVHLMTGDLDQVHELRNVVMLCSQLQLFCSLQLHSEKNSPYLTKI